MHDSNRTFCRRRARRFDSRCISTALSFLALLILPLAAPASEPSAPDVPRLAGDWWRIATPPTLERHHQPGIQTVDFTVFQAADGTWQLISCLRGTAAPGGGRLLYRWEAENLTDTDWEPRGIFLEADPDLGQREGRTQAPHCVMDGDTYYLFYNSNGAYCMISEDGKEFRHHRNIDGELRFFQMGRDVMLFDNRERDGLWYAYYTHIRPGRYPERNNHTVGARTAPALEGPWSRDVLDLGVVSPPPPNYRFAFAESPFVFFHNGWHYRLEQLNVLASQSPREWDVTILTALERNPMAYMAPEIVEHEGEMYIAGYRDHGRDGIFMNRLTWEPAEAGSDVEQ